MALKAGIPGKDGVAFSERINMRDKLHQLEAARDYLADKCPDDLQDGYAIAKDPFLIRRAIPRGFATHRSETHSPPIHISCFVTCGPKFDTYLLLLVKKVSSPKSAQNSPPRPHPGLLVPRGAP